MELAGPDGGATVSPRTEKEEAGPGGALQSPGKVSFACLACGDRTNPAAERRWDQSPSQEKWQNRTRGRRTERNSSGPFGSTSGGWLRLKGGLQEKEGCILPHLWVPGVCACGDLRVRPGSFVLHGAALPLSSLAQHGGPVSTPPCAEKQMKLLYK